ncbi:MAG: hypothetical protein IPQ04_15455 [Saprospiraceae bacterium]|nr:hypothetical protein [Saprospiraceae bacterium]
MDCLTCEVNGQPRAPRYRSTSWNRKVRYLKVKTISIDERYEPSLHDF